MIERITPAILERQGRVVVEWNPDATWADADSRRIEQIFENLLENAIRHSAAQEVVVSIKAQPVGEEIEIVFSDNGPGIPYG